MSSNYFNVLVERSETLSGISSSTVR